MNVDGTSEPKQLEASRAARSQLRSFFSRSSANIAVGISAFLIVVTTGMQATADTPPLPLRTMTLAEALGYAHAHQPAIRAALARVAAEKERAEVPRAQWLPNVGVTAQVFGATANNTTGTYLQTRDVAIPRIGATRTGGPSNATLRPYGSTIVAAGVNQELFDFGRIAAQSAAADAMVDVRKLDAETATLDIGLSVEEAFFAVDAAKAVLVAAEGAYQRSQVHRDLAAAGVHSGLRSPIELTRAEADLQRFDIERIRARGGVLVAQTVFAASVGVPEPALDSAGDPATPSDVPTLGLALDRAAQRDPELLSAIARLRAQQAETRAIAADLRPDVAATATISGRAGGAPPSSGNASVPGEGFLPVVPNWDVGVILSVPLFDGSVNARQRASRAFEQVRESEIDLVREQLRERVTRAYIDVSVAQAALPGLKRASEAAVANYGQADARFKAGLGTSVELADAEALRADAEIQMAIGIFNLAKARAALGRAIAEGL